MKSLERRIEKQIELEEKVGIALSVICLPFLLWLALSLAEIMIFNLEPGHVYSQFNLLLMIFGA